MSRVYRWSLVNPQVSTCATVFQTTSPLVRYGFRPCSARQGVRNARTTVANCESGNDVSRLGGRDARKERMSWHPIGRDTLHRNPGGQRTCFGPLGRVSTCTRFSVCIAHDMVVQQPGDGEPCTGAPCTMDDVPEVKCLPGNANLIPCSTPMVRPLKAASRHSQSERRKG